MTTKELLQARADLKSEVQAALNCCNDRAMRRLGREAKKLGLLMLARALFRHVAVELVVSRTYVRVDKLSELTKAEIASGE